MKKYLVGASSVITLVVANLASAAEFSTSTMQTSVDTFKSTFLGMVGDNLPTILTVWGLLIGGGFVIHLVKKYIARKKI